MDKCHIGDHAAIEQNHKLIDYLQSDRKQLKAELAKLKAGNKQLREVLREAACPDILHCDNGIITNTFNNELSHCPWCEKREQALKDKQ